MLLFTEAVKKSSEKIIPGPAVFAPTAAITWLKNVAIVWQVKHMSKVLTSGITVHVYDKVRETRELKTESGQLKDVHQICHELQCEQTVTQTCSSTATAYP
jgi:hypothetical protein